MIASDEQLERYRLTGRIVELLQHMSTDNLVDLAKDLEKDAVDRMKKNGDRKDLRINCLISVDYSDSDRFFKDYIQDISPGGVFIKTREAFSIGEEIVLSARHACPKCGFSLTEISPRLFSFNSPQGACPECSGLGFLREVDPEKLVLDPDRALDALSHMICRTILEEER